jgi:hypothetical protein
MYSIPNVSVIVLYVCPVLSICWEYFECYMVSYVVCLATCHFINFRYRYSPQHQFCNIQSEQAFLKQRQYNLNLHRTITQRWNQCSEVYNGRMWYVNLYLYIDLMEFEINIMQYNTTIQSNIKNSSVILIFVA